MPRKVIQTSYCTHLLFEDALQTGLGMGMGMNGTAQEALPGSRGENLRSKNPWVERNRALSPCPRKFHPSEIRIARVELPAFRNCCLVNRAEGHFYDRAGCWNAGPRPEGGPLTQGFFTIGIPVRIWIRTRSEVVVPQDWDSSSPPTQGIYWTPGSKK